MYHAQYGIKLPQLNIFDVQIRNSTLYLQSGTPGFEYHRPQMSKNIHFIGPLMPYSSGKPYKLEFEDRIRKYDKVILVTQGTFEGDVTKLIIPTLEAFKGTNNLVVVTTAGWETAKLRERYLDHDNIIIDDFIPFNAIMPYADVYVSNGGYGGVMLSINNKLPMVVGGIHEGKNEICARVGYFKLGVDLRTERPKPEKVRKAVQEVMSNNIYQKNVERLAVEFVKYDPLKICQKFIEELPAKTAK
jgi:UDP:flavonoid glycosyltransferase YjiC (YdhE family)